MALILLHMLPITLLGILPLLDVATNNVTSLILLHSLSNYTVYQILKHYHSSGGIRQILIYSTTKSGTTVLDYGNCPHTKHTEQAIAAHNCDWPHK